MFLLLTWSCLTMTHECHTSKQTMPDKAACIAEAERKQARADAAGLTRFILICRPADPQQQEVQL